MPFSFCHAGYPHVTVVWMYGCLCHTTKNSYFSLLSLYDIFLPLICLFHRQSYSPFQGHPLNFPAHPELSNQSTSRATTPIAIPCLPDPEVLPWIATGAKATISAERTSILPRRGATSRAHLGHRPQRLRQTWRCYHRRGRHQEQKRQPRATTRADRGFATPSPRARRRWAPEALRT